MGASGAWRGARGHAAAIALVVLASVVFSAPMLSAPGVPNGDDVFLHFSLADGVRRGLADGHVYPRWLDRANHGFGIPALVGYPPFGAYAVALTRAVTGDLVSAMRAVILLANLCAGLAFLVLARRFASPLVAGIGAALYVLMPYHFVTIYQRFAFAEFLCFVWMPLVLKFGLDVCHEPRLRSTAGLCLSVAGLVVSHVVVAHLFVVVFAPVLLSRCRPVRRPKHVAALLLAACAGVLLAGAYVIPAFASRHLIHWEAQYASDTLGFAFSSGRGLRGVLYDQVLVTGLACCVPLAVAVRRRARSDMAALAISVVLVVVLQLELSRYVWRHVPGFSFVLYPSRLLALLTLLAPVALTWAISRRALVSIPALLACAAALWVSFLSVEDPRMVDLDSRRAPFSRRAAQLWNEEHVPATVPSFRERHEMVPPFESDGRVGGEVVSWQSHSRRLRVVVRDETAQLRVRTFFFPGWQATVNGQRWSVGPDRATGLVAMHLQRGVSDVRLEFRDTPDRTVGKWVSLGTLGGWAVVGGVVTARRRRRALTRVRVGA